MSHLVHSLRDFGLPSFLQELAGVVIALLDESGNVLAANQGFLRLIPPAAVSDQSWDVRSLVILGMSARWLSILDLRICTRWYRTTVVCCCYIGAF